MRRILILVFLVSLALAPIGIGSPTDGSWADRKAVPAADVLKISKSFRGGERACVLALGGQKEVANLRLEIYDPNGILVAEDKGNNSLTGDFVAVIWYPPRDGKYRIELHNPGAIANLCYIAIK